jgi:deoxyribonuclease-2
MLLVTLLSTSTSLSCKNFKNESVDWFAIFKVPNMAASLDPDPTWDNGTAFFYHDDHTLLLQSPTMIDATLSLTLSAAYSGSCDVGFAMFNDQFGETSISSSFAHMKAVLMFDMSGAVWLTHSVPHFPPVDSYSYVASGLVNGQAFQCLTLPHWELETICANIIPVQPFRYAAYFPDWTESVVPSCQRVSEPSAARTATVVTITSVGGRRFSLFAKPRLWGQDLYADLVAPALRQELFVQSWRTGASVSLPTECGEFAVHNVQQIYFGELPWATTKDHSKWAVGDTAVCIGDINRVESQRQRGGTTVCHENATWAQRVKQAVAEFERCPE